MILFLFLPLLDNRDYLLYPVTQPNLILFIYIINYYASKVLVKNTSNESLSILYHHKLGYLIDIIYNNYFLTNTQSAFDIITSLLLSYHPPSCSSNSFFLAIDFSIKTVLDNEVKVYKNAATVK